MQKVKTLRNSKQTMEAKVWNVKIESQAKKKKRGNKLWRSVYRQNTNNNNNCPLSSSTWDHDRNPTQEMWWIVIIITWYTPINWPKTWARRQQFCPSNGLYSTKFYHVLSVLSFYLALFPTYIDTLDS